MMSLLVRHNLIIIVISRGGILHLPELGYSVPVKSGDAIGIRANEQLHRFEADAADPGASQVVLTTWTDEPTMTNAVELKDFHQIEAGNLDLK